MNFYFKKLFYGLNLLTILMINATAYSAANIAAVPESEEAVATGVQASQAAPVGRDPIKAKVETKLNDLVANGTLSFEEAQGILKMDPVAAWMTIGYAYGE